MTNEQMRWDEEADVVVVGFGGAGVSAAIEAADNGARVKVVERFSGGGATKASGGIIYAGGGTSQQKEAGFDDTPENMFQYLTTEVKGAVRDKTLMAFCQQSASDLEWVEKQGVRFNSTVCPYKTCYPPNEYYLYFSGNESFYPYNENATPAPRGHRPEGKGLPGPVLFGGLKKSALKRTNIQVQYRCRAKQIITDDAGNVIGLEVNSIPRYSLFHWAHRLLYWINYKMRYFCIGMPALNGLFDPIYSLLELTGKSRKIRTRKGVILAAGGFIFNRNMVQDISPKYLPGTPLGTLGDNGNGIKLGQAVGGSTSHMERISAWRFITPPESFVKGVLIDRYGNRVCNEQLYGAQMGEYMVENHEGKAWLIIDSDIWKIIRQDTGWGKARWFQTMTSLGNLYFNRKKAGSLEKLAAKTAIPVDTFKSTIESYNEAARTGKPDSMNKAAHHVQPIEKPPYYAIDCSLGNRVFPCATISLGGLVIDEQTSEVLRNDGSVIKGLYAIGRNAAGIPSKGYVSGLAIAHCIFSGRQAGRHAAQRQI